MPTHLHPSNFATHDTYYGSPADSALARFVDKTYWKARNKGRMRALQRFLDLPGRHFHLDIADDRDFIYCAEHGTGVPERKRRMARGAASSADCIVVAAWRCPGRPAVIRFLSPAHSDDDRSLRGIITTDERDSEEMWNALRAEFVGTGICFRDEIATGGVL